MSNFINSARRQPFEGPNNDSNPDLANLDSSRISRSVNHVSEPKHLSHENTNSSNAYKIDARWLPLSSITAHLDYENPRGRDFPFTFEMFHGAPKIYEITGFKRVKVLPALGEQDQKPAEFLIEGELKNAGMGECEDLDAYIERLYVYINEKFPEIEGSKAFLIKRLEKLVCDAITIRSISKLEQPIKVVPRSGSGNFIVQEGHRRICMHILMGHEYILGYVAPIAIKDRSEWLKGQLRADLKEKLSESQLVLTLWRLYREYESRGEIFTVDDVLSNSRLGLRSAYMYLTAVKACQMFLEDESNPVVDALTAGCLKMRHFASTGDIKFPVKAMKAGDKKAVYAFLAALTGESISLPPAKDSRANVGMAQRFSEANKLLRISPKDNANDLMYWMLQEVIRANPEIEAKLPNKEKRTTANGLLESIEVIDRMRKGY